MRINISKSYDGDKDQDNYVDGDLYKKDEVYKDKYNYDLFFKVFDQDTTDTTTLTLSDPTVMKGTATSQPLSARSPQTL